MSSKARITIYGSKAQAAARRGSFKDRVKVANDIAAVARGTAPRRSGHFANSFRVSTSDGVRVENIDSQAIRKEYGTSRTPAHSTLTSAAMRYGKYTGWRPR